MDRELIDQLWDRAMRESIENGEQVTRYRFAELVFELGVKDGPDYKHGFADGAFEERQAIFYEWHSCVMSDLEHGVKCLNEKAADEWHKNYPAQSKMFPDWIEARGND